MPTTAIDIKPYLFPELPYFAVPEGCVCVLDTSRKWNKRDKATHRYTVADVNGKIELTIPIVHPDSFSDTKLKDIRLSRHGQWWHIHKVSLESAYGRTPYFEHYFPSLKRFFCEETVDEFPFLWQYLLATDKAICAFLDLNAVYIAEENSVSMPFTIPGKETGPYHQIRKNIHGFLKGLSVLDILFNIGPEAQIFLRKLRGCHT